METLFEHIFISSLTRKEHDLIVAKHCRSFLASFPSKALIRNPRSGSNPDARMSDKRIINVSKPVCILFVPLDSRFQPIFPRHFLPPSKLLQLAAVNGVPQIIELPVWHKGDQLIHPILEPQNFNQLLRHLQIANLVISPNIQNHPRIGLVQNDLKRTSHILHIQKVAGIAPITMQSHRTPPQKLIRKLGDQLLRKLMRAVDVIPAGNDTGEFEGAVVGFNEEFGPGFGGRVGVGRFEDVFLLHRLGFEGFALAVDLVGGDVDEAADSPVALGRLEHDVGAEDVALGEIEGISEGVVDVGLGGEVHDGVDVFLVEDVGDEVRAGDVAFNKFEVF
mmetsp:Transcript_5222/g.10722  ORF Transcript_5222/g.10722 Transcript_5222/m.10722 type:complete len:334 (-) Transcript_5222:444-1445(-)